LDQIYEDIYDTLYPQKLFETSSGLLLRVDLHRAFDRYEWGIYCGDVSCGVFVFNSISMPGSLHYDDADKGTRSKCRIYNDNFQDGALYIHIFDASDRTYVQYHGKRIDPATRFKIQEPSTGIGYPDRKLLQWHYKQCVQARIRGYAYDMSINAQGGAVAP
jgi:hypothetical protein